MAEATATTATNTTTAPCSFGRFIGILRFWARQFAMVFSTGLSLRLRCEQLGVLGCKERPTNFNEP